MNVITKIVAIGNFLIINLLFQFLTIRVTICEGFGIYLYIVQTRAESAIAFSRLHPEAAKEINPTNPACLAIAVASQRWWASDGGLILSNSKSFT
jgi:hypothetical protein